MIAISLNVRYLAEKSFALSVLVHILAFNVFLFAWPMLPEPHKPKFVFLGSILSTSDVIVPLSPSQTKKEAAGDGLSVKEMEQPLYDRGVEKPAGRIKNSPQDKRTIKHIEIEEEGLPEKDTERETRTDNVEIDPELDPYKPLRLKPND